MITECKQHCTKNEVFHQGLIAIKTTRYLLHYLNYLNERMTLHNPQNADENILGRNYTRPSDILLFGDSSFNHNAIVQYIFHTKKFDVPITNIFTKVTKF